jgi:hypothetical protein
MRCLVVLIYSKLTHNGSRRVKRPQNAGLTGDVDNPIIAKKDKMSILVHCGCWHLPGNPDQGKPQECNFKTRECKV